MNDQNLPFSNGDEERIIEQTVASRLTSYEECPNCFLDEDRWVYQCLECEFFGCYDEVYENGCYLGSPDERLCPECNGGRRKRIGKIGKGSVEEMG